MTKKDTLSENPILLQIQNFRLCFTGQYGPIHAVTDASLTVHSKEIVALVGASGSGKTALCRAILRLHSAHAQYESGQIFLLGQNILNMTEREMQNIRGKYASMIFQDPLSSLDPVRTIGQQIIDPMRLHMEPKKQKHSRKISRETNNELRTRAEKLLSEMGLEEPRRKMTQYPRELSGGQRQRAAIAIALASDPNLLIADEPTTALDPGTRKKITSLLRKIAKEKGKGILFVTHDLNLARGLADRILVMKDGHIIECGTTKQIFSHPKQEYTRKLVRYAEYGSSFGHSHDVPKRQFSSARSEISAQRPFILQAKHLSITFPAGKTSRREILRDFSLQVRKGEILGIIGPSGCGKTTLARILMGICTPDSGEVVFQRGCQKQMIFQDSASAFNERMTLGQIIGEPLLFSKTETRKLRRQKILTMMDKVLLDPSLFFRHPYEVSGGQRQRAAIARALITSPDFLIADEPVSSLDVPVQAEILHLLRKLHDEEGLTMLLISHDIPITEHVSDRILLLPDNENRRSS